MENAGRILLMPKGDYSAGTLYEMLDLVNHSGASWVCKKACTGQTPSDSNTEYWQRFGTAVDLSNYVPFSFLTAKKMDNGTDLNDCTEVGVYYFDSYATNYVNIPSNTAHNGIMVVRKQSSVRVVQEYTSVNTGITYKRTYGSGNVWTQWKELFTTDGGTIKGTSNVLVVFDTTSTNPNVLRFRRNGVNLGHIGFVGVDEPTFISGAGDAVKYLFHTGNKPTGSYTGNGSASSRNVKIGGIGRCLIVWSVEKDTLAIVTRGGTILKDGAGNLSTLDNGEITLYDVSTSVSLNMYTSNSIVNENGVTYEYALL